MKHRTTITTLIYATLVAAFMAVFSSAAHAQQTPDPGTDLDPGEVVTVNAQVVRVGITIPNAGSKVRWDVRRDSQPQAQFTVDSPDDKNNPLSLVVIVDIDASIGASWRYSTIGHQLESLPDRLKLKAGPRVFVASPAAARIPFKLPSRWPASYHGDARSAFDDAISAVEKGSNSRHALLIITNRLNDLPKRIFEDTDARLLNSAALIYLMTVQPQSAIKYGSPDRTISRVNLVVPERIAATSNADLIDLQFRQFVRVANSLHVISFPLSEEDMARSGSLSVEVKAVSQTDGRVFVSQPRTIPGRLATGISQR